MNEGGQMVQTSNHKVSKYQDVLHDMMTSVTLPYLKVAEFKP